MEPRDAVRITETALSKGYVDAGLALKKILLELLGIDVVGVEVGGSIEFESYYAGKPVRLKINRPKTRNGAFRRLGLPASLRKLLNLNSGDELQFLAVSGRLELSVLRAVTKSAAKPNAYPDKLMAWSASQKGGVRLIFDQSSGKPLNEVATALAARLSDLGDEILTGKKLPRLIVLAGGAGNGKTHAIERFLLQIAANDGSSLRKQFTEKNKAQRVVSFSPNGIDSTLFAEPVRGYHAITIIQDASEIGRSDRKPGEVLADCLMAAMEGAPGKHLLLVCVNRGVLFSAANVIRKQDKKCDFLEKLVLSLNPLNVDMDCWPLSEHPSVYVWPLDIDSVAERGSLLKSPVEQVLEDLAAQDWSIVEALDPSHPLRNSHGCLKSPAFRQAFARGLREFEVASGKNISFRQLYSLIAYLFSGGWTSLEGTKRPTEIVGATSLPAIGSAKGNWAFCLKIYSHSLAGLLFPILPSTKAIRSKTQGLETRPEGALVTEICDGIDEWGRQIAKRQGVPGADLFVTQDASWNLNMDPVRSRSDLFPDNLEMQVSLHIRDTVAKYRDRIDEASRAVLCWLAFASEELGKPAESEQSIAESPRWVPRWINRLASVFLKRALAVSELTHGNTCFGRSKIVSRYLNRYDAGLRQQEEYVEKVCAFVLGNHGIDLSDSRHVIELSKGLCQPFSTTQGGAKIILRTQPEGRLVQHSKLRPASRLLVVELCDPLSPATKLRLPVTLGLDELVSSVAEEKQLTGSMPAAIRGAVDTFRLQADGLALRGDQRFRLHVAGREIAAISKNSVSFKAGRIE